MGLVGATHNDELSAKPQASMGVTPNMMMLGQQTGLPIQAILGTLLEVTPEEQIVSEYVAALQDRLMSAYCQPRAGLESAAMHQHHNFNGKVQRREYQAGDLVWIHDITMDQDWGTKLLFPWFGARWSRKCSTRDKWWCDVSKKSHSPVYTWTVWRSIEGMPCQLDGMRMHGCE